MHSHHYRAVRRCSYATNISMTERLSFIYSILLAEEAEFSSSEIPRGSEDWTLEVFEGPVQENFCDCGIFTVMTVGKLMRQESLVSVSTVLVTSRNGVSTISNALVVRPRPSSYNRLIRVCAIVQLVDESYRWPQQMVVKARVELACKIFTGASRTATHVGDKLLTEIIRKRK